MGSLHKNSVPYAVEDSCYAKCDMGRLCTCCVNLLHNDFDDDPLDQINAQLTALPPGRDSRFALNPDGNLCYTRPATEGMVVGDEYFSASYRVIDSPGDKSVPAPINFRLQTSDPSAPSPSPSASTFNPAPASSSPVPVPASSSPVPVPASSSPLPVPASPSRSRAPAPVPASPSRSAAPSRDAETMMILFSHLHLAHHLCLPTMMMMRHSAQPLIHTLARLNSHPNSMMMTMSHLVLHRQEALFFHSLLYSSLLSPSLF